MKTVYVKEQAIRPNASDIIGEGGEAVIFNIGHGNVLKIFKTSDHPDYQGKINDQKMADERLRIHQEKLRMFPKNLPLNVITPIDLATDQSGQLIVGYTMRYMEKAELLMQYADQVFRGKTISQNDTIEIFLNAHKTVQGIHNAQAVIGDFNDLNALVRAKQVYFIDADSFQFGKFLCYVFTAKFVDPILCDPNGSSIMLERPHNANSDWYSFSILLMQSLLFVDPYGGVFIPKKNSDLIPHPLRPLRRITVFNKEVRYPKIAIHYKVLPDEMLGFFQETFEKDKRGEFPIKLLENIRWTKCVQCGTEHARNICPECVFASPQAVIEVITIRGKVTATRFFKTSGQILFADCENNKLLWLYNENGEFKRENGEVVMKGAVNPNTRFRINSNATLIGKQGRLAVIEPQKQPEMIAVDSFGVLPIFDANHKHRYWLQNGKLFHDAPIAPAYIGETLLNQTLFWVGDDFGFGFYRAGNLQIGFVFDAERPGINDNVKINIKGQLIDSTCLFGKNLAWFFASMRIGGKTINQCSVIETNGTLIAQSEAEDGDGSWLGNIRGKCAFENFLLVATDNGIVKIELTNAGLMKTAEFPDTEPFVDNGSHLFPGTGGIYVVNRNEIILLKIN